MSQQLGEATVAAREDGAAAANNNGPREDSRCHGFCYYLGPMAARYPYTGLFLLANFFAWLVRESKVTFFQRQRLSGCQGDRNCLQAEGVLLISMTCFLFFTVMFFSTVLTRKLQDPRSLWHSQWWWLKSVLLSVAALVISTLAPDYCVQFYGNVAPVGAGIFIFIQMISVIRYITRLNYKWCQINYDRRYAEVISLSIVAYLACTVGGIFMIIWYSDCWFNTVFIGTTLLLVYLMGLIALMSKAKGRFMEPGLVGLYIMFLCWSAIRSEPETSCHQKEKDSSRKYWETMIWFVIGLISITVAAFSTGKDYKCIQFRNVAESEDDIPYGYGFFHFVFAMGSMYFGMLFVGWDTHHTMEKWSVDVSWICTWVHIVNEGLAVMSFVAILLARMNGMGWFRQQLARIFGIGGQQHQGGGDH